MFVFDDLAGPERTVAGVPATTLDVDKGVARYDLTVAVYPGADGATGWLEYDTARYDRDTVVRLAGRFTAIADAAAAEGGDA